MLLISNKQKSQVFNFELYMCISILFTYLLLQFIYFVTVYVLLYCKLCFFSKVLNKLYQLETISYLKLYLFDVVHSTKNFDYLNISNILVVLTKFLVTHESLMLLAFNK